MRPKPKFVLSRSGNQITLTLQNRGSESAEIHMSRFHGEAAKLIGTADSDTFTFEVEPEWNAAVLARYLWDMLGLTITEDHSNQQPPYYEVEMSDESDFVYSTQSFSPSWGDTVEYETVEVEMTPEAGVKSARQYTKRL